MTYALSYGRPFEAAFPRTEIFAYSPDDGRSERIFSDAELPMVIKPLPQTDVGGTTFQVMIGAGDHILSPGLERKEDPDGLKYGTSLYELSTDGSNRYRRLFDFKGDHRLEKVFTDHAGSRVGYVNGINGKEYLFIHDAKTGTPLREMDLSKAVREHPIGNIGWLRDGKTLFLTLVPGNGLVDQDDYPFVGTWVLQEDLSGLRQISPPLGFVKDDDLRMQWGLPPILLSDTPDGNYLFLLNRFRSSTARSGQHTEASLALADSGTGSSKEILFQKALILNWFLLSDSFKYLAYSQHDQPKLVGNTAKYEPLTLNLLVQSLQTGEVENIWSKEHAENREPPHLSLAGWIKR